MNCIPRNKQIIAKSTFYVAKYFMSAMDLKQCCFHIASTIICNQPEFTQFATWQFRVSSGTTAPRKKNPNYKKYNLYLTCKSINAVYIFYLIIFHSHVAPIVWRLYLCESSRSNWPFHLILTSYYIILNGLLIKLRPAPLADAYLFSHAHGHTQSFICQHISSRSFCIS